MDEPQLIAGLQNQEPAALEHLVAAHGNRLLRSACLLCGDRAEAEDMVQETFLQATRSAIRFQGRSSLYTWLHSILLNLTRHYHRDGKRIIYDSELASQEAMPCEEHESALDADFASTALKAALGRISPEHREVIVLRYYEHMKLEEIACCLELSKGTVKSRLHYAIAQMQKQLPKELNLFGGGGTEPIQKR